MECSAKFTGLKNSINDRLDRKVHEEICVFRKELKSFLSKPGGEEAFLKYVDELIDEFGEEFVKNITFDLNISDELRQRMGIDIEHR